MSCSFSSSPPQPWDVFLSFHGKDTRHSFTAHLYRALDQAAIRTYRDDCELEKGKHISSALVKAIRDSKICIVVLSQNYASSRWCLNELLEILACRRTNGLLVLPIFYHVDPSEVRHQRGTFGEAIQTHNKHYSVDKWRTALTEISHLSGYHIAKHANVNESDTIQQIVKDTRHKFASHLYDQAASRDDPKLVYISSGLLKAIQDSTTSDVVLSQNYSFSPWCHNELVETRRTNGLVYHLDPSQVRQQVGSFGEAIGIHNNRYSVDMVDNWRDALTEISDLSEYHLGNEANVNQTYTMEQIVKDIPPQVSTKALHVDGHLVGINSAVEEIYQILGMQSNNVRAIGICGRGGIGKTTIAKAFYNKFYHKFQVSCFLENVKEISQGTPGLVSLLEQLLVQLVGVRDYKVTNAESGKQKLKEILSSKKALLVLDDFGQSRYLDVLVRDCNLFAAGSRIIITTRDESLLNRLGIEMYNVKKLGKKESLELFSHHAFTNPLKDFEEDFGELSKGFVDYVNGLPLALKVLGSSLRGRTVSFWKNKLEKVKKIPENEIQEILKLSYDELSDRTVKDIFLDIVLFFIGKDKDEAVDVFNSCDFYLNTGIPILTGIQILVERSLLTIDHANKFNMHNMILDLGKEVIQCESKMPVKSRRLLRQGNAFQSLKYQEGTDKIEGLVLDLTMSTQKHLGVKTFEWMSNLRLPQVINAPHIIKGSFQNSFQQLRCIRWPYCPWKHLSSSFYPPKLVCHDMQSSKFATLWKGQMPLGNLKNVDVRGSNFLTTTSDLSKLIKLKDIRVTGCASLQKFHQSLVQLTNLSHLDLCKCRKLKRLPEQFGDLKGLKMIDASLTDIEQLPDSIGQLRKLFILDLVRCKKLTKLPEQLGNIGGLRRFDTSESATGELLPDSFKGLINLVELKLRYCKNHRNLSSSIWKPSVFQVPDLSNSSNLNLLPEQLWKIQFLKKLFTCYTAAEELTDCIRELSRLEGFNLRACKKVRDMVGGFRNLTSLRGLGVNNHRKFFKKCKNLNHLNLTIAGLPTILV